MLNFRTLQKNKLLYKEEMVLCVPSSLDIDLGYTEFKGKNPNYICDDLGKYVHRYKVEGDLSFNQLVPYLVIVDNNGKILTHKSKKTGAIALGYSSHIKPEIGGHSKAGLKTCMHMAMYNIGEFGVSVPIVLDGYIKTVSETTSGHLGLVYVLHVGEMSVKEDDNCTYEFISPQDLFENHYGKMEEWAKLVLARFYRR